MSDTISPTLPPTRRGGDSEATNPFAGVRLVVEFSTVSNNSTLCPITRRLYRGAWKNNHLRGRLADEKFSRMPDLPGIQIAIDGQRRIVQIIDPLTTEKYSDVLRAAQEVLENLGWGDEPEETDTRENQSDDQLREWVYWCRRWLDTEQVEVVAGQVPEMREIDQLPGRVRFNQFDMSPNGKDLYPDPKDRPPYAAPPKQRTKKAHRKKRRPAYRDERDD